LETKPANENNASNTSKKDERLPGNSNIGLYQLLAEASLSLLWGFWTGKGEIF
jgi:hypothetical protein